MSDIRKGVLISVLVHLLLIGTGFIVYYEIVPERLLKQIEILDFRMERSSSARVTEYQPVRRVGEPSIRDFNVGQSSNQVPSLVELPKVATEFENPLDRIEVPVHDKVSTTPIKLDERIGNTLEKVESSISQEGNDLEATRIQDQPLSLTGDEFLQNLNTLIGDKDDSPAAYYLEGEIKQRTILSEIVPEYPEGFQKNATVEIQFNVYPDGRVDELIVVKKDEPVLEELSLDSLRRWRFNPIPQDVVQKGKITFIYQLQ